MMTMIMEILIDYAVGDYADNEGGGDLKTRNGV